MRIHLSIYLILLIVITACTSKSTTEWVKWRGPDTNGTSTENNWSAEKLDSSNILWKIDVGFGHSAVTVRGNHCYVSGWKEVVAESDTTAQSTIYCLNTNTGETVWSYTYPAAKRSFPGPRSTPVIDGDQLYSLGWEGKLFCLNALSGKEIWKVDLFADSIAVSDEWGFNTSPVIHQELLLLNLNKTGLALNKNTGEVVWTGPYGQSSWASVYLLELEEKTFGVFQSDTTLFMVDVENGHVESSVRKRSDNAINNDVVLLTEGQLFTSDEMFRINGKAFETVWHNDTIVSFFRTGVIVGDYAYQLSDIKGKNFLYCIDLKTGEPQWRELMDGRWGSIMAIGNQLVVLTTFGKVIIADALPESYSVIKELQVLSAENKTENFCWVAPTFIDGKLYIRNSKGEMACINLSN